MGPTRLRDVGLAVLIITVLSYLMVHTLYRYFPPVTALTGLSLLAVAAVEAGWGWSVRTRIREGRIGLGGGRLNPLAVARSVAVAKASVWVGALALGWWLGVLIYLFPQRSALRVAASDTPGVLIAALSAGALIVAALWLQHCCRSPDEPGDEPRDGGTTEDIAV